MVSIRTVEGDVIDLSKASLTNPPEFFYQRTILRMNLATQWINNANGLMSQGYTASYLSLTTKNVLRTLTQLGLSYQRVTVGQDDKSKTDRAVVAYILLSD